MRSPEEGWEILDATTQVAKEMAAELEARIKASPFWEQTTAYWAKMASYHLAELDKTRQELANLKQAIRDHIKKEWYTPGVCTTAALIELVKETP